MAENTLPTTDYPDLAGRDGPDRPEEWLADLLGRLPNDGVLGALERAHAMTVVCAVGALGPARYGTIEDAVALSSSTLSARLDELADAGLLDREAYAEVPPRVEYALTADGEALWARLVPMLEWVADRGD